MPLSKTRACMRKHRTTAFASLAIGLLTYPAIASAGPGESDPAQAAFANSTSFTIPPHSSTFSAPLAQVPAGKRYVIELVSLSCTSAGYVPAALHVGQKVQGGENSTQDFPIPLQDKGSASTSTELFVGTLAARIYADDIASSPHDVSLIMPVSNNFYPISCVVSLSGYLVSLHGGE